MNNTEYNNFEDLEKLTDRELQALVIKGENLHIHTSKASVAKRILDTRIQNEQLKIVKDVNVVTRSLRNSNKELLKLVGGLKKVVNLLNFFKTHWFPQQPVWVKIGAFLLGTVILGIVINLISDVIFKFILRW